MILYPKTIKIVWVGPQPLEFFNVDNKIIFLASGHIVIKYGIVANGKNTVKWTTVVYVIHESYYDNDVIINFFVLMDRVSISYGLG